MSHAAIAAMDPTNPRWLTSEERTRHSATIWKIIVGAAGASALTAMVVASCLDRDVARRDLDEPGYVETTSATTMAAPLAGAPTTAAAASTPATTQDSTGGIAPNGADNGGAEIAAGAPSSTTSITSAPMATEVQPQIQPRQPRQQTYSPVPVPFERANGDSSTSGTGGTTDAGNVHSAGPNTGPTSSNVNPGVMGITEALAATSDAGPYAGHASHANNDPSNREPNPDSPPMSSGAGRFVTEAPYWSSSAWTSNPEAGAGPFETERNTPAH